MCRTSLRYAALGKDAKPGQYLVLQGAAALAFFVFGLGVGPFHGMMTIGKDVSALFPHMVRCMAT